MSDKRTPSIHRRAVLTWIAVYPTITILQSVLGTRVAGYPLPVRTLVLTLFMAPLVTYLMLPVVMKAHTAVTARAARTAKAAGTARSGKPAKIEMPAKAVAARQVTE